MACVFSGCETDTEAEDILLPYTYDEKYYEDLRAYKESDHAIAYVWFADYNKSTSLANRFAGLPDSVDTAAFGAGSLPPR